MNKSSVETAVGVFVLICLLCVGYLTVRLGQMQLMGGDTYTVQARFTSVAGLKEGSSVELAGVQIGQVRDISLNQDYYLAEVVMSVDNEVKLSQDSIVSVKTQGLIGDKYLNISPGGSPDFVEPGGTLTETESAVDIEGLISKYAFGSVEE
ncbi:outer membrane lipid asymmetry maintenance protein MlaD [Desulfohalovibrio reitneri]|uniref:outer membrane lipid asymmetry maintenance protein MlaD n=1 Tax=Desulfohalovibrio reitneri TaxID=1307759 RepID=UPI0004A6E5AD|nr:outer membrane lipid asymmetry maintenance protein MlaD [Desulfohalovibrio reitneri]